MCRVVAGLLDILQGLWTDVVHGRAEIQEFERIPPVSRAEKQGTEDLGSSSLQRDTAAAPPLFPDTQRPGTSLPDTSAASGTSGAIAGSLQLFALFSAREQTSVPPSDSCASMSSHMCCASKGNRTSYFGLCDQLSASGIAEREQQSCRK